MQKTTNIQSNGLDDQDLQLVSDAINPKIAIVGDGLASARKSQIRWRHTAYAELIR